MNQNNELDHEIDAELLEATNQWEETDHDEPAEYYFSSFPDPYLKPQLLPPDHVRHNFWIDEEGSIHVKNISAYWIPELTITEVIHGTTYTVTGSYEGTENFVRKLERITSRNFIEKQEDSE